MTGPGPLDTLTTQMADFLDLVDSQGLPPLHEVTLRRSSRETEWEAAAQLSALDSEGWQAVREWSIATGGSVHLGEVHYGSRGYYRRLDVTVSYAGLRVRVWCHVPAGDPVPAWARPQGECLVEQMTSVGDQAEAVTSR